MTFWKVEEAGVSASGETIYLLREYSSQQDINEKFVNMPGNSMRVTKTELEQEIELSNKRIQGETERIALLEQFKAAMRD